MVVEIIRHKGINVIYQEILHSSTVTLFHRWNTGKSCPKMCFWVLVGLDKFVIDFSVATCVIKPSEGWPLGLAIVPIIVWMEEYGTGASQQHDHCSFT